MRVHRHCWDSGGVAGCSKSHVLRASKSRGPGDGGVQSGLASANGCATSYGESL